LGLLLCAVGIGVLLIEVFLNSTSSKREFVALTGSGPYFTSSELGFGPKSGAYRAKRTSSKNELIYDVVYTIDDDLTRNMPENPQFRKNSQVRINFFGGSFVFGEGLEDRETLPFYVQNSLKVRVKNFGFHGYGPQQAYHIMSHREPGSGSEVNVFITSAFHAPRSGCVMSYSVGSPRYEIVNDTHGYRVAQNGVCQANLFGVPLPRILHTILLRLKTYSLVYQIAMRMKDRESQFALYLQLIKSMQKVSEAKNMKFIAGYINSKDDFFDGTEYSNERLISMLEEQDINVVDLSLEKGGELSPSYYLHEEDTHPSALANEIRAAILVPELSKAISVKSEID
jgi:hypothetical protein